MLVYWEKEPSEYAVQGTIDAAPSSMRAQFPKKRVLLAEVGWPSHGRAREARPWRRPPNRRIFLRRFCTRLNGAGYDYFLMEAFDQPWKTGDEGAVGAYWGVYDVDRKPSSRSPGRSCAIPEWRTLAAVSIVLAVLALRPAADRRLRRCKQRGRGFLAMVAFVAASFRGVGRLRLLASST